MREVWRDIEGYEGLYKISNMGKVKSLAKRVCRGFCNIVTKEQLMTLHRSKTKGRGYYLQVTLSKDGIQKSYRVHRLVANAFLKKKSGCNQVDHIDGNKDNNRAENLRWVSQAENMNNPVTKAASKRVCRIRCVSTKGDFIKDYPSLTRASEALGIPLSSISCMLNGTGKMTSDKWGYVFTRI